MYFELFRNMGIFLALTFVVYLVCMWFIRYEERREAEKGPRV